MFAWLQQTPDSERGYPPGPVAKPYKEPEWKIQIEPLVVDLPEPPSGSYGNDLEKPEYPARTRPRKHDCHPMLLPKRNLGMDSVQKALRRAGQPDDEKELKECSIVTPYNVILPRPLIQNITLSPAQVHALDIGVGNISMEDRWMGRIYYERDMTAVVVLVNTWSTAWKYEFTFRPDEEDEDTKNIQWGPTSHWLSSLFQRSDPDNEWMPFAPARFPRMKLVGLRRESDPRRKGEPAHHFSLDAHQEEIVKTAREELKETLWILKLLLTMRIKIDDGTWQSWVV
ncbi:hypothetical protein OC846_005869 [Tilletia horrida]|uniref:Uncharacterized protein n=1 Tax=Tilletia horrida TaxID=155126 RepID=A0AAN6JR90_9BASI|nr:hypothetical protein OC846_005869 [Tilletia horrida]KAK0544938.1 hypothetical protein OC845_005354 [Tilletia horrida]KAK0561037.1 hypothetical protein OC861_006012 [Tilletia horrida]